jgi:hypothetical protein
LGRAANEEKGKERTESCYDGKALRRDTIPKHLVELSPVALLKSGTGSEKSSDGGDAT